MIVNNGLNWSNKWCTLLSVHASLLMEWVFVMNRMSSQSGSAAQRRRMVLGLLILLLVDVIWVASSELTSVRTAQDENLFITSLTEDKKDLKTDLSLCTESDMFWKINRKTTLKYCNIKRGIFSHVIICCEHELWSMIRSTFTLHIRCHFRWSSLFPLVGGKDIFNILITQSL